MGRHRYFLFAPVLLALFLAPFWVALRRRPPSPPPTPRVYPEELQGRRYVNRDLKLSLDGPESWPATLGSRSGDAEPYEGLVVKMEPETPVDPLTLVRPLVSVVKRRIPASANGDPVAYIRSALLGPGKRILEEPRPVQVAGRTMGRVAYEMASGQGAIRIVQHVWLGTGQAIVVSTMAPSDRFDTLSSTFDTVVSSLRFDP